MRVLVIPDIHNKVDIADRIIKRVKHDRVIFLGDFFDSYGDTDYEAGKTACWLRNRVDQHPNDVFLYGNHDLSYAYPCRRTMCAGWDDWKNMAVSDEMRRVHWDAFKFFHLEGNWLFTHAGLTKHNFGKKTAKDMPAFVKEEEARAQYKVRQSEPCWVYLGGFASDTTVGVTWCRPQEFIPIPGINQVFGHTEVAEPTVDWAAGQSTINLDTNLRYVGIFTGDQLDVIM